MDSGVRCISPPTSHVIITTDATSLVQCILIIVFLSITERLHYCMFIPTLSAYSFVQLRTGVFRSKVSIEARENTALRLHWRQRQIFPVDTPTAWVHTALIKEYYTVSILESEQMRWWEVSASIRWTFKESPWDKICCQRQTCLIKCTDVFI